MTPTMCTEKPAASVLHHLAVAEVLAVRLETQLELLHLALEDEQDPSVSEWAMAQAVLIRTDLREAIGKAIEAAGGSLDNNRIAQAVMTAKPPADLLADLAESEDDDEEEGAP